MMFIPICHQFVKKHSLSHCRLTLNSKKVTFFTRRVADRAGNGICIHHQWSVSLETLQIRKHERLRAKDP
jgi:hypothetical protein